MMTRVTSSAKMKFQAILVVAAVLVVQTTTAINSQQFSGGQDGNTDNSNNSNNNGQFQRQVVGDLDRFNYDQTVQRPDGYTDYGPPEWGRIACDEEDNLDNCIGYPDKWNTGRAWEVNENYCRWCPDGASSCGRHHQSPINLSRDRGIEDHVNANECIDVHWMKYEDSTCQLEHLVETNSFIVDRHALRVVQPITTLDADKDEYLLECREEGVGRRYGRIDFSKGFSDWWLLSHIDFKVPSEHTQEGVRYSAEAQLYHFYSVTAQQAGVANEMGTVSVFLQVYDDAEPYRDLDRVICQWRRYEEMVRQDCGLDPIQSHYPGCFPNYRTAQFGKRRNMRTKDGVVDANSNNSTAATPSTNPQVKFRQFNSVHDLILHNELHKDNDEVKKPRLILDDINFGPAEEKDWDAWIADQSSKMQEQDRAYTTHKQHQKEQQRQSDTSSTTAAEDDEYGRRLIMGEELEWFNYFPMLGARTEYYYRYSGSQTIPPCYGNFQDNSRRETNHWRVLKDPIRIHVRQLEEMKRLIKDRIAPVGDPVNSCQPDTAAKVDEATNTVDVARPVQQFHNAHFKTFCECKDWRSKWPEDREWCEIEDIYERFYGRPYNFRTDDDFN